MQKTLSYYFDLNKFKQGTDHHFNLLWLLVIATGLIVIGLGLREPWPADEPRFAHIAKAMVDSGQWFFPMRGGELYPDKPPIFMWAIALFYLLSGSIKVAFLIPSALCSLITIGLIYDLARRLWNAQTAWYAALLLIFSLQFMLQAKTAQIDAMVCCWITLGCYGLLRFLLLERQWRWYFMAWFFMGIGVITKGVGFLPVLMLLPYLWVRIQQRQLQTQNEIRGGFKWLAGLLVMLAAISLWFIPMLFWVEQQHNPLFDLYRDNILLKQTVTRYANSWHHVKPFWYYLTSVIPIFWLPLSLCLPWLCKPWYQAIKQADRRIILPLGWIVLLLLFFSLSPGKRGVYILPALPMLALVSAPYIKQILIARWPSRLIWIAVVLLGIILSLFAIAGWAEVPKVVQLAEKYDVTPWPMLFALGLIGLISAAIFVKRRHFVSWVVFIPLFWLIYSTWGYSLFDPVKTPKNIYQNMAKVIPPDAQIALIDTPEQFLLFTPYNITHFGYHTPANQQLRAAWQWQQQNTTRYILVDKALQSDCFDFSRGIDMGFAHRVNWILLPASSRFSHCPKPDDGLHEYYYQPQ
ncbi:ArnT family glycosyltransferase [Neptunicella sp. SCSIO 80796]|uniref:ArnT family glycosyltransferase n=1 Tax=Neptunicella plasticusilytica TaxID=3117012 RepID=UPI003A4DEF30